MIIQTKQFNIIASPFRGCTETEVHVLNREGGYIKKLILERNKSQYNFRNDKKKYRTQKLALNDIKRVI